MPKLYFFMIRKLKNLTNNFDNVFDSLFGHLQSYPLPCQAFGSLLMS